MKFRNIHLIFFITINYDTHFRNMLDDYMEETDRYEKILNKIYTRSIEVDEELTERARKTLRSR